MALRYIPYLIYPSQSPNKVDPGRLCMLSRVGLMGEESERNRTSEWKKRVRGGGRVPKQSSPCLYKFTIRMKIEEFYSSHWLHRMPNNTLMKRDHKSTDAEKRTIQICIRHMYIQQWNIHAQMLHQTIDINLINLRRIVLKWMCRMNQKSVKQICKMQMP